MIGRRGARFPGRRAALGAAMASVHESLYFNPMLTNGVVHANVFGVRDWVTPHKMALLVLLSELGRAGAQLGLLERRRLNRLLLPLLQVGGWAGLGWARGEGWPRCVAACRDMSLSPAGSGYGAVAAAQGHRGVLPAPGRLRPHQVRGRAGRAGKRRRGNLRALRVRSERSGTWKCPVLKANLWAKILPRLASYLS